MRIYIDFDDVLCETARALSHAAKKLFQRNVPYEQIKVFDLQHAFMLSSDEIDQLMGLAHQPGFLAQLEPAPGAIEAVTELQSAGHEVIIVTGRPSDCHVGSVAWLDNHGLEGVEIIYVDKYGRAPNDLPAWAPQILTLEQFYKLRFDVAIDDAPTALDLLTELAGCRIVIFNRPWNAEYQLQPGMRRCDSWSEISEIIRHTETRTSCAGNRM
ncbi:MAG: 2-dehydropantoate 2-reductase [Kiritimatiellae bacterium]|nr:2-dehydropantoate 2-reductase [Kiritimatiellia bacterium]